VQAKQLHRPAGADQLAYAQRISEGTHDEEYARNAQITTHPDGIKGMQQGIN
jgi:hypothetical protein